MSQCIRCGCELDKDDIGMHKKMINRGASSYMCVPCLAAYFGVEEQKLREKIVELRESGCMLFQ